MVSTLIRVGGGGVGEKWHLHCKSCCWGEGEMVSTLIRVVDGGGRNGVYTVRVVGGEREMVSTLIRVVVGGRE